MSDGKTESEAHEETVQLIAPGIQRDLQNEVVIGFVANLALYAILIVYFVVTFWHLTSSVVPYMFIDEVFHIKQTIQYIEGNWRSWDPKITTPPGLYLLGWGCDKIMSYITSWSTNTILRLVNLFGGIVILPLVVLRPMFMFNAIGFWPVALMSFPLMTTFYYLFYTDVWSTIFILQSLNLALTVPLGNFYSIWLSASCAGASCLFRQTNIIWTGFIMIVAAERRAAVQKEFNTHILNNYLKLIIFMVDEFKTVVLPYAINFIGFFIYLLWNRSITLGDKSNHSVGLHLVQIFYCFMFLMIFTIPLWVSKNFLRLYKARWQIKTVQTIFELIGIMLIIRVFTYVHPFLLADNRHFTFYLFKKIIHSDRRLIKYFLMAPVYHFSTFVYLELMRPNEMTFHPILPIPIKNFVDLPMQLTHISWTALILCTIVTLVPSPLFEPRYYILPFYFWRLFITCSAEPMLGELVPAKRDHPPVTIASTNRLLLETLWFMAINIVTLIIFVNKTFMWETEEFPQRIIW